MMTSFLAARFLSLLTVFIVDCQILKRAFYSGYQDTVYFLQQSSEFLSDFYYYHYYYSFTFKVEVEVFTGMCTLTFFAFGKSDT